jgi:2-polyprenyl-3-methyl-5-hydroxy-6-metoxy-1,4-benzoquinol methylase
LDNPIWPQAVDQKLVCNSESDKFDRAETICDFFIDGIPPNAKFLDFGCGEGHLMSVAAKNGAIKSIGYDIQKTGSLDWESLDPNFLTTSFDKVKESGPYDIVVLYDVLDHAEDPVEVLKQAKSVLAREGTIYVRCHPYCGRHGGHMYRQINKAYVHLILDPDELQSVGLVQPTGQKVIYPILTYKKWISDAGLVLINENIIKEEIEDLFRNNLTIKSRIVRWWKDCPDENTRNFPEWQLGMKFVDYRLQ